MYSTGTGLSGEKLAGKLSSTHPVQGPQRTASPGVGICPSPANEIAPSYCNIAPHYSPPPWADVTPIARVTVSVSQVNTRRSVELHWSAPGCNSKF